MGKQIYIFFDKSIFKEKLDSLNNEFELEELLSYLLFLKGFLQEGMTDLVEKKKVRDIKDLKRLIVEIFDNLYEGNIEEFKENLESDISKDLFNFFIKDWKETLVPFVLEQSMYLEGVFIPFEILDEQFLINEETKKKLEEEKINLKKAIKLVVEKLGNTYKKNL